MMLFWTWLNTYFVSSSSSGASLPSSGGLGPPPPPPDQWRPLPSRAGARRDGSDPARRCFVSVLGIGEDGDPVGLGGGEGGGGGGGRCITVSQPKNELDRLGHATLDDLVRRDFMVSNAVSRNTVSSNRSLCARRTSHVRTPRVLAVAQQCGGARWAKSRAPRLQGPPSSRQT